MLSVSTPLKMSAASIRLAGYMIESNLRVAHVLGTAALKSNPFVAPVQLRKRPVEVKIGEAVEKPAAKRRKPVASLADKAVAPKIIKARAGKPANPGKPPVPAKMAKSAVSKVAAPAAPKSDVSKPVKASASAAPKITKPKPEKPAAPTKVNSTARPKAGATDKPATVVSQSTPATVKAAAKPVTLAPEPKVARASEAEVAFKRHRAPSTPPAMPNPKSMPAPNGKPQSVK